MTLFLQITQTVIDSVANNTLTDPAVIAKAEPLNMLTLIMKGGWIMIPLIILSMLTVYFAVERFLVIRRASRIDQHFMSNIRDYLLNGKMEPAVMLCRNTNTPIARLLGKGIKRIGKPIKEVESAVESEGAAGDLQTRPQYELPGHHRSHSTYDGFRGERSAAL
jgi:biopolymer transport protein ExbB